MEDADEVDDDIEFSKSFGRAQKQKLRIPSHVFFKKPFVDTFVQHIIESPRTQVYSMYCSRIVPRVRVQTCKLECVQALAIRYAKSL